MPRQFKLTRALWIVVLALITPFLFKGSLQKVGTSTPWYQCIPRFIIWFVVVILLNTYLFSNADLIVMVNLLQGKVLSSDLDKVKEIAVECMNDYIPLLNLTDADK